MHISNYTWVNSMFISVHLLPNIHTTNKEYYIAKSVSHDVSTRVTNINKRAGDPRADIAYMCTLQRPKRLYAFTSLHLCITVGYGVP